MWCGEEVAHLGAMANPEQLQEIKEQVALGYSLMEAYPTWAQDKDNFVVLYTEQEFRVPILNPFALRKARGLRHSGRLDAVVRDSYGRVWIMDHKTASSFPSEGLLRLDEQMGYYLLAATYLFPNEKIAGVLYNVIRKTNPAKARTPVFARYPILYNRHQIKRLQERLYLATREIIADEHYEPNPSVWGSGHCSWRCSYKSLCLSEEDGTDVEALKVLFDRKEAVA